MAEILIGSIKKGEAEGVAELDASGRVPSTQLPSYVNDVLEFANLAAFPAPGETGKIYIATDTNKTYRWSGAGYAEISALLKRQADTLYANALIGSAQGDMVHVEDAWDADAVGLSISGKAVQDGTPTPDAPVEIDVVDSPVSVQATGKNLFRTPTNLGTSAGVTATANIDSSITISGTPTGLSFFNADLSIPPGTYTLSNNAQLPVGLYLRLRDADGTIIAQLTQELTGARTVTTIKKAVKSELTVTPNFAGVDVTVYPQIELGSTVTAYEPYTSNEQTITLPSDHNYLASLPDGTCDELVLRSDGVAVLVERVSKIVFDGSTDEAWSSVLAIDGVHIFWTIVSNLGANNCVSGEAFNNQFWSHFATNNPYSVYTQCAWVLSQSTNTVIRICHPSYPLASDAAGFRTWLAANPVTVCYKLATPATSYSADNGATWSTTDPAAGTSAIPLQKGTNYVWCTDPLSPEVALEYVQDTNKVINDLRAAIVASGATN